eukprot:2792302-Pyramimonas_sp.AAC.1
MSERTNAFLDQARAEIGCKQNMSKQEIPPVLSGPGSGTHARDLRMQRATLPASRRARAGNFGGRVAMQLSARRK